METGVLIALLAILVPIVLGPFTYLVERISAKARTIYAVALGFITGGLTLSLIPYITKGTVEGFMWIPGAGRIPFSVCLDSFSVVVAIVAGVIGALVLLYSTKYMKSHEQEYSLSRYYWQALLFIGGMIGLALTSNLLVMYVFWEIIGFCSYALIAYYYHEPEAVPAGIKAFIVTRIGDIGLLAGILILWQATGTLDIFEITSQAGLISVGLLSLAGIGFLSGAIGKSAQFPLHVWLPDAMAAPTTITALIHAACLVNAGIYLLARSYPIFVELTWWPMALLWIGAVTALMAATVALTERDIKRVLAYSTISQLGYMMAAIGAGALLASQFHLVSHGIFKALLFLGAGSIMYMTGGIKDLHQMGGLAKYMPITRIVFIFGLLSLVGIPVWTGFFSKDMIMSSLLQGGAYIPLALLIIATFFTAAYSWRMYWLAFQGEKRTSTEVHESPPQMTGPLIILAFGSFLFWLCISPYTASMAFSLPAGYHITPMSLGALIQHAFTSPIIVVTVLIIVTLIVLTLKWRATVINAYQKPSALTLPLMNAYWIDTFYNRVIVKSLFSFCQQFRRLQTGDLNYNNLAIAIGLVIFLIMLFAWGVY
jgi:NADH-quinone oxidoreductase subunit L